MLRLLIAKTGYWSGSDFIASYNKSIMPATSLANSSRSFMGALLKSIAPWSFRNLSITSWNSAFIFFTQWNGYAGNYISGHSLHI